MSSNINPNNIDTTYPIPGQDNDSQGFRDNFTNIKTNFQYAEDEISDLQSKVVLKAALAGTTLDNDMGGALIKNPKLQGVRYTPVLLDSRSGTVEIDFAAGQYFSVSTGASISLDFANIPSAGNYAVWQVAVTVTNTSYTLTLPSSVGNGTSAASLANIIGRSGQVISFASTGTYTFQFSTANGGTTIFIEDLTRVPATFYTGTTGTEDLASGAAASLIATASYFSTSAAETATLAAGEDGQIKVFAMYADGGNMVITVTNAGWKTSGTGTITFDTIGQTCTLMYINSKWFCIGNNGAVFA